MPRLAPEDLRKTINNALEGKKGARFMYQPNLLEKLANHGVTVLDLIHICRTWKILHEVRQKGGSWRYKIGGFNCDGKWMAVVLTVLAAGDDSIVVAITGFRFSRGRTSGELS